MAVQSYLTEWDQCQHSDNFKHVTLDRFLAIPYRQLMEDYGEHFAKQHRSLCDTLRKVLMEKLLSERTQYTPPNPRKPGPVDIDNLSSKIKRLSIGDRLGAQRKLLNYSPRTTAYSVSKCKDRVSVKDRLGVPVSSYNRGEEGRFRLRAVHGRPRNGTSECPGTSRHNPGNYSDRDRRYRDDSSRRFYPGSRATTLKNGFKGRFTPVYV